MLTASVSPAAHLLPRLLLLLLGDREHRDFGHRLLFLLLGDGDHCDVVVMLSFLTGAVSPSSSSSHHITIYFSCLELHSGKEDHCGLDLWSRRLSLSTFLDAPASLDVKL